MASARAASSAASRRSWMATLFVADYVMETGPRRGDRRPRGLKLAVPLGQGRCLDDKYGVKPKNESAESLVVWEESLSTACASGRVVSVSVRDNVDDRHRYPIVIRPRATGLSPVARRGARCEDIRAGRAESRLRWG